MKKSRSEEVQAHQSDRRRGLSTETQTTSQVIFFFRNDAEMINNPPFPRIQK